jgi:histidyl-tRNA synthetase
MVNRPKGTQDFLDLSLYNFILESAKKFLNLHHFHEIATPILESAELFKRSLGTYTDVVGKEMFTIAAHQQTDKEPLCLRPEMTASTVRAFIENNVETTPWRVFSHGPLFRYERPQKGRFRQFHQLNIELIGAQAIAYDAQFICMLDRWFHDILTLNNYTLLINFLGCPADRATYRVTLQNFLAANDSAICETCRTRATTNTLRVFDFKNKDFQTLFTISP